MSTISAIGGASSAWADLSSSRASAMKERMFAKVDCDSSGTVDKTELQGLLAHMAAKSGNALGTADDLFGKMDSDGNGSLSEDELDAGMKSLLPSPSSTVDFAQQREAGATGGPPAGAPPGPPPQTAGASGSNADTDPLDTDGNGTVSAQERAAGELQNLLKDLMAAAGTSSEVDTPSTAADQTRIDVLALLGRVQQEYGKVAANASQTSTLSLAA